MQGVVPNPKKNAMLNTTETHSKNLCKFLNVLGPQNLTKNTEEALLSIYEARKV